MRRVTQADIAKALDLSPATVALVVGQSNSPLRHCLRKETVQLVLDKARELGYRPNRVAQAMQSGRSNLIVHLNCGGYSELAGQKSYHVGRFAQEAGFDYQVIDSYWWGGEGEEIIDRVLSLQPEGVVISGSPQTAMNFQPLRNAGIPLVGACQIPGHSWVRCDARGAVAELTRHCLRQGRIPALILHGSKRNMILPSRERQKGFLEAVQEAGFASVPDWEITSGHPAKSQGFPAVVRGGLQERALFDPFADGMQVARRLVEEDRVPGALVCTNDFYALGAMTVLLRAGLRIPEDVMVTGFDNLAASRLGLVSLTTVEQPVEAMCKAAVELLKKRIAEPGASVEKGPAPLLACQIHWRDSTAPVATRTEPVGLTAR